MTSYFHIMERMSQNQKRCVCMIHFARWQHQSDVRQPYLVGFGRWRYRGRSLPSPTASCFNLFRNLHRLTLRLWFIYISMICALHKFLLTRLFIYLLIFYFIYACIVSENDSESLLNLLDISGNKNCHFLRMQRKSLWIATVPNVLCKKIILTADIKQ